MRTDVVAPLDPTARTVTVTVRSFEPVASFRRGYDTVTINRFYAEAGTTWVTWESSDPIQVGDRFSFTLTERPVPTATPVTRLS